MNIKILSSSKEIKVAIKDIFSVKNQRRVAISAFVGDEANAYLPYPKGIELYCWPKAGGTNPNAIRDLQTRGVDVYFSDSLHMKLYWSKKGLVVTSANLSTYALGSGGLKEIGVLLPASSIDINKIIQSISARGAEDDEITNLEKEHKKIYRTNPDLSSKSKTEYSFRQWYELKNHGKKWKIAFCFPANVSLSKKGSEVLEREHGSKSYERIMEISDNDYEQDDWILSYEFNGKKPVDIEWIYAHHVVKVLRKRKDKTKYHYQIIQANKLKAYDKKPFEIDAAFKKAFSYAHQEIYKGDEDKMDDVVPSKEMLSLIYKYLAVR